MYMAKFRTLCSAPIISISITAENPNLPVKSGLSMSPSEMMRAAEQGRAITTANSDYFFDGEPNPSWDISILRTRGVDMATIWEASMSSRKKISKAVKTVQQSNNGE